ncbi:MAG: acyltransferase [Acidimicrobiia bacterium]|nr:acyltransferase [Acidimicrobiia bacterium]
MSYEDDLLAEFADLVARDELVGQASRFLADTAGLVDRFHATGEFYIPPDPFKGTARQPEPEPTAFYTMFWRMFDKTPASMLQGFAIPLRRILAQRIFKHCGDNTIIHHNVLFNVGSNIELGEGALLNRYVMLDDRASLRIGAYTMVAAGVTIETHTHPFDDFTQPIAISGRAGRAVTIGPNTVLGYNTVVMAGVTIGERCIVGANSVVTKDVPDFTVVGGVPAKPIKRILPPPDDVDVWQPPRG